jgi:hypothetical protein
MDDAIEKAETCSQAKPLWKLVPWNKSSDAKSHGQDRLR